MFGLLRRTGFGALVLLGGACLGGCAAQRPAALLPEPPAAAPDVVDARPAPDELYARLAEGEARYREAIAFLADGAEVRGEEGIVAASETIRSAALDCAGRADCEIERFVTAFERLLGEQELALKQQAARVQSLETDVAELSEIEREPGTSSFVAVMPEIGRTESLLRGTDLREIITLNGPVKAAIHDWLTWMRPMLLSAYENYQFLRDDIAPVFEQAGLPEALLFAMLATESGGKVHAYSPAGAAGLLQFMRRTGRTYGLGVVDGFDTRLDPVAATRAAVAYLNDRFAEFNDSLDKALAAYNGGESRMRRLAQRRDVSLWDGRVYWSLPRETREYVPRILAAAWLFLHPEDYNLEFPAIPAEKAEIELRQPTSIGELAICLGQAQNPGGWFRTLRNLNPRYDPGDRLEAGERLRLPESLVEVYETQCVDGRIVETAKRLHDASYPDGSELIPYVVQPGDTLGRIAGRHRCVDIAQLAAMNGIRPPRYVIRVGQVLKIPHC